MELQKASNHINNLKQRINLERFEELNKKQLLEVTVIFNEDVRLNPRKRGGFEESDGDAQEKYKQNDRITLKIAKSSRKEPL